MRLAGHNVFSDESTAYQQSLMPAFRDYAHHPIVVYTKELATTRGIGFDSPMWLAIHLEKIDGQFHFFAGSSFWEIDERWTPEIAERYLELLNDFYIDTDFSAFFEENVPYFEAHSQRLRDELWGKINLDWFYQFGLSHDDIRITIRPSGSHGGFGPTLLNSVSYAILPQNDDYGSFLSFAVHEFAHTFANLIAEVWYEENKAFRSLSKRSVDTRRMPWYGKSTTMAKEYVTRAYTILYLVENHNENPLPLLIKELYNGFRYIENVYVMITEHEPMITPFMRFSVMISRSTWHIAIVAGGIVVVGGAGVLIGNRFRKKRDLANKGQ
jgi:hypothetical protein